MRAVKLSGKAKKDARDIAEYTVMKYGQKQADRYMSNIFSYFQKIAHNPCMGVARDDLPNGCRCLNVGKHVLIYTAEEKTITVLRVLHQNRDVERLLGKEV